MSPQTATLAHILTGELAELDRITAAHTPARKPVHVSKLMLLLPLLAGLALIALLGCTPHTQMGVPTGDTPAATAPATAHPLTGDLATEDTTDPAPASDIAGEDTSDSVTAIPAARAALCAGHHGLTYLDDAHRSYTYC